LLVVQEQLLVQADVALTDWPPQGPEVNPIENMWSKVKKTMHKSWPVLPLRNNDALWTLLSDDFL
jgi:transposase